MSILFLEIFLENIITHIFTPRRVRHPEGARSTTASGGHWPTTARSLTITNVTHINNRQSAERTTPGDHKRYTFNQPHGSRGQPRSGDPARAGADGSEANGRAVSVTRGHFTRLK